MPIREERGVQGERGNGPRPARPGVADGLSGRALEVLGLQRSVGNAAVSALLQRQEGGSAVVLGSDLTSMPRAEGVGQEVAETAEAVLAEVEGAEAAGPGPGPGPEPGRSSAPERPTLRLFSRGPAVVELQGRLNVARPPALPPLDTDGIFGELTRAAVIAFQTPNDLVPDGIVGRFTHAALDAQSTLDSQNPTSQTLPGPTGAGPTPTQTLPTLAPGPLTPQQQADAVSFNTSRYDERSIRIIQGMVGVRPITGVFDTATAQAVATFQRARGLTANGRVEDPTLTPMVVDRASVLMHDQAIHLVTDFNDLDVTSDTLSVHFQSTLGAVLSDVRFESGNLRLIRLGPRAFVSSTVMRDEIRRRLQAPPPTLAAAGPPPAILDPVAAQVAALLNGNRLGDPRSVRIIQGLVGAAPDGVWSPGLVQRVALFQRQSGLPANGLVEENRTLPVMSTRLIAAGDNDAVLRLIVDFFDFRDNGNLISIYFDPTIGTGRVANAFVRVEEDQPSSIQVGPNGMAQPFAGIVHTVAHEMEHIRQLTSGERVRATREFLAHALEVMSEGLPEVAIEDHDQMTNPRPPFGFANDARRTLSEWNRMPLGDRARHRDRFLQVREKVLDRIRAGTPQARTHAKLLAAYQRAFDRLPPF